MNESLSHPVAHDSRPAGKRDSIPDLIKQLADELSALLRKELSLAKAELREAADQAKSGVIGLASGFGLVIAGIVFILLAAVLALAMFMPGWVAALTVGIIVLIVGMIVVSAGKRKIRANTLVPERTVEAVREDVRTARRAAS